mmetsp:Transcript_30695/g.56090  ORF Transcript_30695/g.56090 Transcript_30695/m.56090 type:complete len:242 (-) Transcript_30695:76-801(-)
MGIRDCLCSPCYCCCAWAGSVPYLSLVAVVTSLTMSWVAVSKLPTMAQGADALGFNTANETWMQRLRMPLAATVIADCMALLLAFLSCSKVQEHFRAERRGCCFSCVQLFTSKFLQAMVFKLLMSVWVMHFISALATSAALPGFGIFITGCDISRPVIQQLAAVFQLFGLSSRPANINRFCRIAPELYVDSMVLFAAVALNVVGQTALLVTTSMNCQRLWLQPKLDPVHKSLLADEVAKDV